MPDKTPEAAGGQQSKVPLYVSIALLAVAVGCYFLIPGVRDFLNTGWNVLTSDNQQRIGRWVGQFGWLGPAMIVLVMIVQMFLLVVPTPLIMVVSILAYGPWWGSVIVLVGIFSASTTGYWIGGYFGPSLVNRLLGHKSREKVESFIDDYGFWAVIVTRLSPFLSNDAISFVGGLLQMSYWRFMGATMLGIVPLTALIAYLGENNDRLKSGLIWGSVISIALFGAYVWWDKRRKKKEKKR